MVARKKKQKTYDKWSTKWDNTTFNNTFKFIQTHVKLEWNLLTGSVFQGIATLKIKYSLTSSKIPLRQNDSYLR